MVRTPLDQRPRKIDQMHLWPGGRRNLGPLQGVPPVPRTRHPHRLELNPHGRTARRMADTVPGNRATHHRPQADGGTRGGPQRTRPHSRLHPATHPRGGPPSHGGAHATDGHCQDYGAAHIPHPQVPAAWSNPTPNRPSPPPQTPNLPTMRTYPMTHQHGTPSTPTHHPPSTTLARHTQALQAPHKRAPACARRQPPSPHATVRPQVPPAASHCMPPLRTPAATTDAPALQPRPLGLSGSRAPRHTLPPLRGAQPSPSRAARGPRRTPPASRPSFFGPLTHALRDHLGGYYVADVADHTWTIAVATGSAPLPPHSPFLRHSGGGLNVAARHVLLALYLHHRDLHLPDPQLPAPKAAALTPEVWADTAPEEIAAYLRITCRRFNTALGRQKGTPYPLSAPPTRHTTPPHAAEAPGGLGVLSGRPPGHPRRGHRHADGPHGPARLRHRPRGAPPRGAQLALPLPFAPKGTGGFTRPRHPPGQEDQDWSGGLPARPPAWRDTATRARVQRQHTTPGPDTRGTPTAPPPPAPTNTTVPQLPNPAAQAANTASTPCQDHHTRRARGHGTTNTTTTRPSLPTPTP